MTISKNDLLTFIRVHTELQTSKTSYINMNTLIIFVLFVIICMLFILMYLQYKNKPVQNAKEDEYR
jgi:hypothetical protein